MSYVATISVVFPCSRTKVYDALSDLDTYPLWNSGLKSISQTGPMTVGLHYRTESLVNGQVNVSEVEVVRMIPGQEIELVSDTGLISYRALFRLLDHGQGQTEVICVLRFEFHNFVLNLGSVVVEAMAEARIRGDFETLRAMLEAD